MVNAIYKNLYPDGTHLGYPDEDFFFHVTFTGGRSILVRPGEKSVLSIPIRSGSSDGTQVVGPLALVGFGPLPHGEDAPADSRALKTENK